MVVGLPQSLCKRGLQTASRCSGRFISANSRLINGLEIVKQNENLQATSFLVMVTLLHEFVHYGRVKNNLNDFPAEYGNAFEEHAFGGFVTKNNANKLYKKNGWKY
jgi:Metallopeptidase toxin 3